MERQKYQILALMNNSAAVLCSNNNKAEIQKYSDSTHYTSHSQQFKRKSEWRKVNMTKWRRMFAVSLRIKKASLSFGLLLPAVSCSWLYKPNQRSITDNRRLVQIVCNHLDSCLHSSEICICQAVCRCARYSFAWHLISKLMQRHTWRNRTEVWVDNLERYVESDKS